MEFLLLPILPAASRNGLTAKEPVQPTNPARSWTCKVGPTVVGEKELPVSIVLGQWRQKSWRVGQRGASFLDQVKLYPAETGPGVCKWIQSTLTVQVI